MANFKASIPKNCKVSVAEAKRGYIPITVNPEHAPSSPTSRQYPTKQFANSKSDMMCRNDLAGEKDGC